MPVFIATPLLVGNLLVQKAKGRKPVAIATPVLVRKLQGLNRGQCLPDALGGGGHVDVGHA